MAVSAAELSTQGRWVYLPEEFAAQHPLYGPHGWASGLLLLLFLGPVALLVQDYNVLQTVYRIPFEFYALIAAEMIFALCAWSAAIRLSAEREDFYPRFWLTFAIGMCCGVLFFAVTIEGMPRQYTLLGIYGTLERIVTLLIVGVYVSKSRRLELTCRKRVDARDPFLRTLLTSKQTFEEAAAARPRRPWFFRRVTDTLGDGSGRRQTDTAIHAAARQGRTAPVPAPRPRPLRPPHRVPTPTALP